MVTPLVRRPRTKPPVELPQRAEYDGRAGQSIRSILSEQPSFGFLRFAAGDIGWQHGGNIEEWRCCFSAHLQAFVFQYMNSTGEVPEEMRRKLSEVGVSLQFEDRSGDALSGIWNTLAVYGIKVRQLPHLSRKGVTYYQLPFGLLMLVSEDSLSVTRAACEYAHGAFTSRGMWLSYIIIGPLSASVAA
jgi:hypothetical protein